MREILDEPVRKFVIRDIVKLREDASVRDAAELMKERNVESIIVVDDEGNPIGIITERDILYRVVAEGRDPSSTRLKEVASKPLVTVKPELTVREAIALMIKKNIRRVPVIEKGKLIGVIVMREVIGDLVEKATPLLDIEVPEGVRCPFCGSVFKTREELSKHIDRMHIGGGVLEGVAKH